MNLWDSLTHQAYNLLTRARPQNLTPSVVLVQSLHKAPITTPSGICSRLADAPNVLPALARHARQGDRHALLMAAVLMRYRLRRIAELAAPEGFDNDDPGIRANDTLEIFFTLLRSAAEPEILTERYIWGNMLRTTLAKRPKAGTFEAAIPTDPQSTIFDRPDYGPDDNPTAAMLQTARDRNVITELEHHTLHVMYLHTGVFNLHAAAHTLDAKATAVERRAQRAIKKISHHLETAAA